MLVDVLLKYSPNYFQFYLTVIWLNIISEVSLVVLYHVLATSGVLLN